MTVSSTADTQAAAQVAAPKSALTADFNMFLQMLTTQMQNQDPLDPMDTSEYTQQLVQFSQVEQSMQQTEKLTSILGSLSSQGMAQAAAYIGREARFDTDISGLKGESPATWTYAGDLNPTSLVATVKNMNGKVVATVTLDPERQGRFQWNGKLSDGSQAADGAYSLSLEAKDVRGNSVPMTINSVGVVREVVSDGTNVMLGVNGLRLSTGGLVGVSAASDPDSGAG